VLTEGFTVADEDGQNTMGEEMAEMLMGLGEMVPGIGPDQYSPHLRGAGRATAEHQVPAR